MKLCIRTLRRTVGAALCLLTFCAAAGCAARPAEVPVSTPESSAIPEAPESEPAAATADPSPAAPSPTDHSAAGADTTTAPAPSTAGTTEAPAPAKLALTGKEAVTLTPTAQNQDGTAIVLTTEKAAALADCLNRQAVKKGAYKSLGEYTFVLDGRHFSVSLTGGWLNLLDDNDLVIEQCILLGREDAKLLNDLIS